MGFYFRVDIDFFFLQPNERANDEVTPLSMAIKQSSMPCLKLLVQVSCLLHSDCNRISLTDAGSSYVIMSVLVGLWRKSMIALSSSITFVGWS